MFTSGRDGLVAGPIRASPPLGDSASPLCAIVNADGGQPRSRQPDVEAPAQ